ncbi:ATP-grasp fold amidoligase family protein [Algiphilus sp.]|uniref:ATP-grasp fold amidoligase family protein n=1 Tax=Algiphilus sp. TaxID=1872431 RepID=UPI0025B7F7EB|nr:ATP-grasp fold amidoligase family protein [Algiphilus sp.]MCK5768874.1 hypothetical protein [Algiphilus sp.]
MPPAPEKFHPTPADRPARDFLTFIRQRFRNKAELIGDPVPWELDDKLAAYVFGERNGCATPVRRRFDSLSELWAAAHEMDAFVIKQPGWHSSIGIHVLQRLAENHHERGREEERFLNLLTLRTVSADAIGNIQDQDPEYWVLEELIPSHIPGKAVPPDYKVYCFNGEPGFVLQIDRNASPPRGAIFDAAMLPLEHGRHYHFDTTKMAVGNHILPLYPAQLLHAASRLAKATGSSFVSVDMYDGPVLGELTFAPGGPAHGMISFSPEVLQELDRWICGSPVTALSGLGVDLHAIRRACADEDRPLLDASSQYAHLASAAAAGDLRYGRAFPDFPDTDRLRQHWALAARMIGLINGDRERALQIYRVVQKAAGFLVGLERADEYEQLALSFCAERASTSAWHARMQERLQSEREARLKRA